MSNESLRKWAETLTGYSVCVQPGQTVAIVAGVAAEPLAREVYRQTLKRGGYPVMLPSLTGLAADLLKQGDDAQLEYISPVEQFVRTQADVVIYLQAETNTRAMSGVDPARQTHYQRARRELIATYMERDASGAVHWVITLYPTAAYAQEAEMSTDDFATFVEQACKLDADDPVAAWQAQAVEQQRLIDWLTPRNDVHIVAPGTDLRLSIAGRLWMNADGRKNFPDGEIFTGPVENSANGHITFSYPAIYQGREVDGVHLRFEDGTVVDASATKGQDLLLQILEVDAGARYLGEFAFGTNFGITRFVKHMLFDEKIGGSIHLALGAAYLATGSANKSSVHWDMLLDLRNGGTATVDGEPFLVDGRYVV